MTRRLIIISFDAMVYEDLAQLREGPCFSRILKEGARVNRIRSIYPSLTYPAHTSILTGVRAGAHGVVNNEPALPGRLKCDWYWFHDVVKVPDLHDAAKKAGLTTASVFWPVTGSHPNVDYLVAEYWAQGKEDTLEAAYKRAGTDPAFFEETVKPLLPALDSWESPKTDPGKTLLACEIIRRYKPHLLTLHLGQVDYYRHRYGVFNDKVTEGVRRSEEYVQMIFDACREAGIMEETDFAFISDHGQINYTRKMNLNKLLKDWGYIKTDEKGDFVSASVWAKSANYSAQVYLTDPSDKALEAELMEKLSAALKAGDSGIGAVYSAREAKEKFGLYGDFSFVLESDETTLFFSDWHEPLFAPADEKPGYERASHGHDPSVGPQAIFLLYGPHVKPGVVLPGGELIDEAPTFARLLNIDLPSCEGKAMEALLRR